ncbi:hypothetical protein C8F01DRAFT_1132805 [Mycena amicta]|nr:hypothetical protein C8F01DRAFT_1132805 [Mycena amicta]
MPPSKRSKPAMAFLRLPPSTMPSRPDRLARKYRNPTPTYTSLTREQIEYLVAEANAKTEQRNKQWKDVPDPIPDTARAFALSTPTLVSRPHASSTSSHVPLPTSTLLLISASLESAPAQVSSRRLSGMAISLIAVAGVCFLLAVVVAIKLCIRPARRPRPVPSRPILNPSYPEDDIFEIKLEDSPVFGGKERLSERPDNGGLWQWTQYSAGNQKTLPPQPLASDKTEKPRLSQVSAASTYPAPMQQVHNALNRAANRISLASASLYPASPAVPSAQLVTSFTADGHSVIERVNPKILQRSRSNTAGERSRRDPPQSKSTRYSYGFAYDGAEVVSPKLPMQSPTIPIPQGRTRIMSSYYAHPRTSHTVPTVQVGKAGVHTSGGQDKKLSAFDSPATIYPVSPQPTLYPDDSLSVVEAKRQIRPVRRTPTPNKRVSRVLGRDELRGVTASPTVDATAALGNLMLMDFSGTKQSAMDVAVLPSSSSSSGKGTLRSDDKPPRVPSPPPLPSLAQMGLQHANPTEYAEYRSPTYSIYNLY